MKRSVKLTGLVGILVLCVGAYFIVSAVSKNAEQPEDTGYTIADYDGSIISRIDWTYQGEENSLQKTDGNWSNAADADFPVKQSAVSSMTEALSSLSASRRLEGVSDLSQYGLETPTVTVYMMTENGEEAVFAIGSKNDVTSEYYIQYAQGDTISTDLVYLVPESFGGAFCCVMKDLLQMESLPSISDINMIKVESSETYRLSFMGDDEEFPWTLWDADSQRYNANTSLCESVADAIKYLSFIDCVDYHADTTDLSQYGLDDPNAVVTVSYPVTTTDSEGNSVEDEENLVLSFGGTNDTGDVYVQIEGYSMLYTVSAQDVEAICGNTVKQLTTLSLETE